MEHVTQAEIEAFIREAHTTYPEMNPHDAVMRLALEEGRAACKRLALVNDDRRTKSREFRDKI